MDRAQICGAWKADKKKMADDLKIKWDRVTQKLRAELGEDLYSSWFARMELEDVAEGRLVVSVPTRFLKSWIETH